MPALLLTDTPIRKIRLLVFVGGATTLAVELSASRLLGAYFGVSNAVWAAIISLILFYLAIGYFVGGLWADRQPAFAIVLQIGAWAGFVSGLIPLAAQGLLPVVVGLELPLLAGVLGATALLYLVPIVLLGCLLPFAIRLAVLSVKDAGAVTGGIFTWSTLGSILGSLVPVLYLLPAVGTRLTFWLAGGLLLGAAMVMLFGEDRSAFFRLLWVPVLYGALLVI